jgi:hypothetical protein
MHVSECAAPNEIRRFSQSASINNCDIGFLATNPHNLA